METEQKIFVCDLDGTLLHDDKTISKFTEETIKKVVAAGHKVVLASGRDWQEIKPYYYQLGLEKTDALVIANNGSRILHPTNDRFSAINNSIHRDFLKIILGSQEIQGFVSNNIIKTADGYYIDHIPEDETLKASLVQWFHLNFESKNVEEELLLKSERKSDIMTCVLVLKPDVNVKDVVKILKNYTNGMIDISKWSITDDSVKRNVLELNSRFGNKIISLAFLQSYYVVSPHNVYFFGDGQNDTRGLGDNSIHTYCMANGCVSAYLSAANITEFDNNHDGVARELIKILELK